MEVVIFIWSHNQFEWLIYFLMARFVYLMQWNFSVIYIELLAFYFGLRNEDTQIITLAPQIYFNSV